MPKKILLADDSITIQKVVELTFSDGDYQVIATNNGTKAIEEIPRVKPDIILSDIIMPEKNGYEVCEWVKSHPEYRKIPVILLTGTFEPFDPDRAEKAGCDAVVTKPFESQSLIQKVEELIGAGASPAPPAEEAFESGDAEENPLMMEPEEPALEEPEPREPEEPMAPPAFEMGEPSAEESSPFEGSESRPAPMDAESSPFPPEAEEPAPQGDVFGGVVSEEEPMEDSATRMIPKMSMEDLQRLQQQGAPPAFEPPAPEPEEEQEVASSGSAWEDEPYEGATKIIPKLSMEEIQRLQQQQASEEEEAPIAEASPFGGAPEEEEVSPFATEEPAAPEPAMESSSFDQPEPEAPAPFEPPVEEPEEDSSTRMIPKLAFADVQRMQQEAAEQQAAEEEEPIAEDETPEAAESSLFGMGAPAADDEMAASNPFAAEAGEESASERMPSAPFTEAEPEPEPLPPPAHPPETTSVEGETVAPAPGGEISGTLSEEQIERIARRVVEMLSDKAVREIAWEVIPETAEMVVRERIRELEGEEG